MSNISVGVRIPQNLHKKLTVHAAKADISKSEVIISALAHYLSCTEDIPLSQRVAAIEARLAKLEAEINKN